MERFIVEAIEINVSLKDAFQYIADTSNLPEWTNAFSKVEGDRAIMVNPNGQIEIGLEVVFDQKAGTIDWIMTLPDGAVMEAHSRVTNGVGGSTIYSFVLPMPKEEEGMAEGLREELQRLKRVLEQ